MTNSLFRQKAIELRKLGKTYSEIRKELLIPKSTLSDWLSNYPLTKEQFEKINKTIQKNKELAIEKYRNTMRLKREIRLQKTYKTQKEKFLPFKKREIEIAGLFLYWGEGNKYMKGPLSLCNTDPKVIKFFLYWIVNTLKVSREKVKVLLHLYSDMNMEEEKQFWSSQLKLPIEQFTKPYIKQTKKIDIDQKGFGHGTCTLVVSDIRLKEKVMMSIEAIADFYCCKM